VWETKQLKPAAWVSNELSRQILEAGSRVNGSPSSATQNCCSRHDGVTATLSESTSISEPEADLEELPRPSAQPAAFASLFL
jgi:hypothetical protein